MANPFRREIPLAEISEINIVPLADVSLVLLILLMVLSPMMTQDMLRVRAAAQAKEAAPEEAPLPIPAKQEMVLVVALHVNGISVGENFFQGPGSFIPYMTSALAAREDKKVFLAPDPGVKTGLVVNMLETLKGCGAASVALVQNVPTDSNG